MTHSSNYGHCTCLSTAQWGWTQILNNAPEVMA